MTSTITGRMPSLPPPILLKYYLYTATTSVGFSLPIWVLFLVQRGLSYTQITVLDALFGVVLMVSQTPTGYVADRFGRRAALAMGSALVAVALTAFAFSGSFVAFLAVYLLWGLGQSFRQGSGTAWLYDVLRQRVAEDRFAEVQGNAKALQLGVTTVSVLLAGYLASVDMRYPFIASAVVSLSGLFILLTFPKSRSTDAETGSHQQLGVTDLPPLIREFMAKPSVTWFVAIFAITFAVLAGVEVLIQPIAVSAGFGLVDLGGLYVVLTLAGAVVSYKAGALKELVGPERWFYAVPVALGVGFLVVIFLPVLAVPIFALMYAGRAGGEPLAGQYLHNRIGSRERATLMSATVMTYQLLGVPITIGAGLLADYRGPLFALSALGGLLVVSAVLVVGQHLLKTSLREDEPTEA